MLAVDETSFNFINLAESRADNLLSLLNNRASKTLYRDASNVLRFIQYDVDWDTVTYYRQFNRNAMGSLTSIQTFAGGTFNSIALTLTGGTLIPQGTRTFGRTGGRLSSITVT